MNIRTTGWRILGTTELRWSWRRVRHVGRLPDKAPGCGSEDFPTTRSSRPPSGHFIQAPSAVDGGVSASNGQPAQ
jgi:hypothetical protein